MSTIHIDVDLLPRNINFDPPLSGDEFETVALASEDIRMEQTEEGTVVMMTPTGGESGRANSNINLQLGLWAEQQKTGAVFDSSTGFRLPDGSSRLADAAYVTDQRLCSLGKHGLKRFPKLCPNFVIELRSETDCLKEVQTKMQTWIRNGAELGWLVDPADKRVFVYRPERVVETVRAKCVHGEGPVAGFVLD